MDDAAARAFRQLAKELQKIYSRATSTTYRRIMTYTTGFLLQDALKKKLLDSKLLGKDEYTRWKLNKVFKGLRWQGILTKAIEDMLKANRKADRKINEREEDVFGKGANRQLYDLETKTGTDTKVTLYEKDTVAELLKDHPELLPRRKGDERKARGWCQTRIANAIAESMIRGESIPDTARRLADTLGNSNMRTMTRYARTAMTAAQNAGRMDAMQRAAAKGIHVQKKWLATLDQRTRDSHRDLDGQVRELNEAFRSPLGRIMYPGDIHANPADVWNCRCTLIYVYPDFEDLRKNPQRRDNETKRMIPEMTYREWERWKRSGRV